MLTTASGADLVKWAERLQVLYDEHKRRRDQVVRRADNQAASVASIAARRRGRATAREVALRALPSGRTEIR